MQSHKMIKQPCVIWNIKTKSRISGTVIPGTISSSVYMIYKSFISCKEADDSYTSKRSETSVQRTCRQLQCCVIVAFTDKEPVWNLLELQTGIHFWQGALHFLVRLALQSVKQQQKGKVPACRKLTGLTQQKHGRCEWKYFLITGASIFFHDSLKAQPDL